MKRVYKLFVLLFLSSCTNKANSDFLNREQSSFSVRNFENDNFNNSKDYYESSILLNHRNIKLDLNFESDLKDINQLILIDLFLSNLGEYSLNINKRLQNDFEHVPNSIVNEFVSHHLYELKKEELKSLFSNFNDNISDETKIFNSLNLKRIGIYPNAETYFAVFDYSIENELSQYLISVYLNSKGEIVSINLES